MSLRGEIKLNSFNLMGVRIDPLTMERNCTKLIEKFVLDQRPLHLMGVNADKINQCQTDESIKRLLTILKSLMQMGLQLFLLRAIWVILCQSAWQALI